MKTTVYNKYALDEIISCILQNREGTVTVEPIDGQYHLSYGFTQRKMTTVNISDRDNAVVALKRFGIAMELDAVQHFQLKYSTDKGQSFFTNSTFSVPIDDKDYIDTKDLLMDSINSAILCCEKLPELGRTDTSLYTYDVESKTFSPDSPGKRGKVSGKGKPYKKASVKEALESLAHIFS